MTFPNAQITIDTIFALSMLMWLGALVMALFAALCGIRIQEVSFGVGKQIFNGHINGSLISLRFIPFSAYVKLSDNRIEELTDDPLVTIDSRPRFLRFLILLSGVLVVLIPGFLYWGVDAVRFIPNTVNQLVAGALSPFGKAQTLLHKYHLVAIDQGFLCAFGIVSIKLGVFYLLPVSPMVGLGQALFSMRNSPMGKRIEKWATISSMIVMLFQASWFIAIIWYSVT